MTFYSRRACKGGQQSPRSKRRRGRGPGCGSACGGHGERGTAWGTWGLATWREREPRDELLWRRAAHEGAVASGCAGRHGGPRRQDVMDITRRRARGALVAGRTSFTHV
jgi:hypothetical protein